MNKKKFLLELEKGLKPLNKSEKEDILEFYDERISNGTSSGKSEEEVINELEPINVIIKNTLKEFDIEHGSHYGKEENSKKYTRNSDDSNKSNRIIAIFGIIAFDIFIASWLVPVVASLALVAVIIPFTLFIVSFTSFITTYNFAVRISLFTGTIGLGVLSLVLMRASILLLKFVIQIILNLHYEVFTGASVKRFQFKYNWKLKSKFSKFILILAGASTLVSAFILAINSENLIDNYFVDPDQIGLEYIEEVDLSKTWDVEIEVPGAKFEIEFYDGTEIKFVYDMFDSDRLVAKVNEETNEIIFEIKQNWTSYIDLNPYQDRDVINVKAYIPNDLIIDDLDIEARGGIAVEFPEPTILGDVDLTSYNGSVTLSNVEANEISISSYNGNITILNLKSDELSVKNYNGDVTASNIIANSIWVKNYNGDTTIENVTAIVDNDSKIELYNYNGDITMNEVYVENAKISNYNGDITYINTDHSYIIHFINDPKSYNGSENIYVGK